ncbi:MAG TPA: hypothetical protein VEG64_00405 [Candidatus Sulfotelmatobacter sp.]|nr:hypothetical protein [Candidatus Sulfotelmatobacter sp.]
MRARAGRAFLALLCAVSILPAPAAVADLKPQTIEAFDRYARLTEAQFDSEIAQREPFLWFERLPESRRAEIDAELRTGKVVIERLETRESGKRMEIPDGLVHHWIGTVFIPGATLAGTLALEQDYDHHQDFFRPDVVRSKTLRRNGNDFEVEFRFYKKKVITTVLETEHEVHYELTDSKHAWSRSRSTRIQEVDDAGQPDERLEPVGHDRGFLWRMDTYWRFEEKDGGTYVESQSISLTRDIPTGLGWLIGPYVSNVPRESLTFTLATTRAAVLQRMAARPQQ